MFDISKAILISEAGKCVCVVFFWKEDHVKKGSIGLSFSASWSGRKTNTPMLCSKSLNIPEESSRIEGGGL